jgi:choline dehydrogenase-like flavoprotein
VGPADELTSLAIDPIVDLPAVGRGFQDHPGVYVSALSAIPSVVDAVTAENEALLMREGRGPMSSNLAEGGGFARSSGCATDAPDLQFHTLPAPVGEEGVASSREHAITVSVYVAKPTSRGSVTLRSNLPQAKPRILNNFLASDSDRRAIRDGLRMVMAVLGAPALSSVLRPLEDSIRADMLPRSGSEEDLDAWIERRVFSNWHPACTCAMGQVVDEELRVYGLESLRVADVSILPSLIRGNTNAPAIMIGERAADLLLGRDAPAVG